ncbi:hypothetical protein THASP1DRAFT_17922 [Thamnocephalis sphaerospora]|uniref:Uncharacterized protein n=1 Tax=Thamnocephalis sphaerospora TaxID=78915 RepID=A0A4P9XLY0_9FUNG|nr:hypothetical protein THASP1DRAFT_17922 [Thamnocephalis sphaerospora]|eukprot:RKP06842.1 hypothetical protein THASP1DRAFT_17922 [Thamnocephalis sphaerospora]
MRVVVASVEYFRGLETLLQKTPPMILHWYLIWRVIHSLGDALDNETALLTNELDALVTGVHARIGLRWPECVSWMESAFSPLLARYFGLHVLSDEAIKSATLFTEQIRASFIASASKLDWLDKVTRNKAIEKVCVNIRLKVGVPGDPDARSALAVDAFYDRLSVNETGHFENVILIRQFETHRLFQLIGRKVKVDEWTMSAASVNMYYSRTRNEITVPAGILRPPFFSVTHPAALNYGSLGMFIGHELSHAFDTQGRKHDAAGRLNDWWSPETANHFETRAGCFSAQYGQYTVHGPDGERLWVNGNLTLTEVLAGELSQAFSAWQASRDDTAAAVEAVTAALPGFNQSTGEHQLFFLGFGRSFCNVIRPENIHTDPHPPLQHRVNGALKNSREFAAAYGCRVGSPMNPEKKCQLW